MREMAKHGKSPYLEPRSPAVSYLANGANRASSWDADSIYGCVGDEYGYFPGTLSNITSYQGSKSHLRECPFGLDSRDLNGLSYAKEVQQFTCHATGGTFTVQFRGFTSASISATATTQDFASTLSSLPVIGNVTIKMLSSSSVPNQICSSGGNSGDITFVTVVGLTPLLKIATNLLTGGTGVINFVRSVAGSGTLIECSGHGNCDRTSGECKCYDTYGTSNGAGDTGLRGDCGRSVQS